MWTQNDVKSEDFFCIGLKLCTVVSLITKFHGMSTVTFPWQHNGLQALSIQNEKKKKKNQSFKFLLQEVLFALVVHSVGLNGLGRVSSFFSEFENAVDVLDDKCGRISRFSTGCPIVVCDI